MSGRYRCLLSDPPWRFDDRGSRIAPDFECRHYETMSLAEIIGLGPLVEGWAATSAHLWLWAPNAFVLDGSAQLVMRCWGFEPKQMATWCKPRIGMGHWMRNTTEQLLLGLKGRLGPVELIVPTHFKGPVGRHSEKPEQSYQHVERVSPGAPPRDVRASGAPRLGQLGQPGAGGDQDHHDDGGTMFGMNLQAKVNSISSDVKEDEGRLLRISTLGLQMNFTRELAQGIGEDAERLQELLADCSLKTASMPMDAVKELKVRLGDEEMDDHLELDGWGHVLNLKQASSEGGLPTASFMLCFTTSDDEVLWATHHLKETVEVRIDKRQLELAGTDDVGPKVRKGKKAAAEAEA